VRPPDDNLAPIDLRLFLRIDGKPLTETWIYQWTPPSIKDRRAAIA
jgi:glucans biosynthesis protein